MVLSNEYKLILTLSIGYYFAMKNIKHRNKKTASDNNIVTSNINDDIKSIQSYRESFIHQNNLKKFHSFSFYKIKMKSFIGLLLNITNQTLNPIDFVSFYCNVGESQTTLSLLNELKHEIIDIFQLKNSLFYLRTIVGIQKVLELEQLPSDLVIKTTDSFFHLKQKLIEMLVDCIEIIVLFKSQGPDDNELCVLYDYEVYERLYYPVQLVANSIMKIISSKSKSFDENRSSQQKANDLLLLHEQTGETWALELLRKYIQYITCINIHSNII